MINDNGNYVSGGDSTDNRITIYPTQEKMQFKLIETITLDADVSQIIRTNEPNGDAYNFDSVFLKAAIAAGTAISSIFFFALDANSVRSRMIVDGLIGTVANYGRVLFNRIGGYIFTSGGCASNIAGVYPIYSEGCNEEENLGAIRSLTILGGLPIPAGTKIEIYATRRHDL